MSSSGSDLDHLEDTSETRVDTTGVKKRRLWTKQEDEKLRLLVSYWGDQSGRQSNWDKIAAQFVNRNAKNCRKRWFHSLDPKLRRGKWNQNEDKVLLEAYEQLGPAWQRIAQLIPGRTDDQCSKRYTDVLDPAVHDRLRPWSKEEDEKLLYLYKKYGPKWQSIASEIKGRTGLVCRNRWRKLTRPPKEDVSRNTGNDINGTVNKIDTNKMEMQQENDVGDIGGCMTFEVPGSTGFPAGADANWFQAAAGAGSVNSAQNNTPSVQVSYPSTGLNIPNGVQKHVTVTIEDVNASHQDPTHHAVTSEQLDRIIAFVAEHNKQIVIHQHIYQTPPPPGTVVGQQLQPLNMQQQSHPLSPYQLAVPVMRPMLPSVQLSVPGPVAPPSTSSCIYNQEPPSQQLSRDQAQDQGQSQLPQPQSQPPPPQQAPQHHTTQSEDPDQEQPRLQAQAPALQPHTPNYKNGNQFPLPPPDEFLSRPLLYEDPPQPEIMAVPYEGVDFLAFNPS